MTIKINKIWNIENRLNEFVIWGCQENSKQEVILLSEINGDKIINIDVAIRLKDLLKTKYKCHSCRIQSL